MGILSRVSASNFVTKNRDYFSEVCIQRSNRQKSNRAAMDNNYMLTILAACFSQHDDISKPACQ